MWWHYTANCSSLQDFSYKEKNPIPHIFTDKLQNCITMQMSQKKRARCFETTQITCAHMPFGTLGRHMKQRLYVHSIVSTLTWKFGSRFIPPIKILHKNYSSIWLWPERSACSCKTLTDITHKSCLEKCTSVMSYIQWHNDNLTMLQPTPALQH